jgi:hypothetical protein
VSMIKNLQIPFKEVNTSTTTATVSFSRVTLLHGAMPIQFVR